MEEFQLATHKSAEKRARQSIKKTARNGSAIGAVRTAERKLRDSLAAGEKTTVGKLFLEFASKTDSAVSKGVIHYKTAARKIGRLASRVHQLTK